MLSLGTSFRASSYVRALLLGAALGLAGCSNGDPNLGQVTGRVTLDGQPLPRARIVFQPSDGKSPPSNSITDDEGRYVMRFNRRLDGAVVGQHSIRITTGRRGTEDRPKREKERIPTKYNVDSELVREVKSGSQEFNFELEGKGKIVESED